MLLTSIFSVPATWEPDTISHFLEIAGKAGFGQHKIGDCLTEPQAVAVFAMMEEDQIGQVRTAFYNALNAKPTLLHITLPYGYISLGSLGTWHCGTRTNCRLVW